MLMSELIFLLLVLLCCEYLHRFIVFTSLVVRGEQQMTHLEMISAFGDNFYVNCIIAIIDFAFVSSGAPR